MMKFEAFFDGREKGALGIMYPIVTTVTGVDEHEATLNLYEHFDHIHRLKLTRIYDPLTAYEITYEDGSTSRTNMAADVTLEDAARYFVGKRFNVAPYPYEKLIEAVMVAKIEDGRKP
jgi:hypothetical protein